jgi:hypothetical protein
MYGDVRAVGRVGAVVAVVTATSKQKLPFKFSARSFLIYPSPSLHSIMAEHPQQQQQSVFEVIPPYLISSR